jgi:CHAT domain-containing protein
LHDLGRDLAGVGREPCRVVDRERAVIPGELPRRGRLAQIAQGRGGVFRSLSRFDEALAEYEKAANVYEKLRDERSLAGIAQNRGVVFESLSRFEEALTEYGKAASGFEVLKDEGNLTDTERAATYKTFGVLMGLGTAEMIAERGRTAMPALPEKDARRVRAIAVELRQAVEGRDRIQEAQRKGGVSADSRKGLDDEFASVVDRIRKLEVEGSLLVEQARQRQQVYVGIQYPKAATAAEVQSELEPDAALLEYAVDGGEVFAFVTTRTGQRLVALGDAKEVLEDVGHVREALVPKAAPPPQVAKLRKLGARLLDPLLSNLPKEPRVTTLLVAGHGDLARIPFEILLVADPKDGASLVERPYLVSSYDVAYVHSGTVMRSMRLDAKTRADAKRNGPDLVGFGFPFDAQAEADEDDLPEKESVVAERGDRVPLPGSAAEVLEIAKLFAKGDKETKSLDQALKDFATDPMARGVSTLGGERFSVHLRMGATEDVLKRDPAVRNARILHLACHGEADLISPSLSRLVLAPSSRVEKESGEDGFVYLRELRDLGISAELLVLSACETNAGKLHPLEGITGLSRAGLAAGAESVISTFWRVDDAAARTLMVDFYRRWLGGGTTRIAALCDAKRQAIKDGLPMKTWSAYALWDAKTR